MFIVVLSYFPFLSCFIFFYEQTPLHLAALRGNVEVVEYLVANCQASTTIRDKNGCTPLMLAMKKEQLKTEWVLRRLTSTSTWDLISNMGLSRLKNKMYILYFMCCVHLFEILYVMLMCIVSDLSWYPVYAGFLATCSSAAAMLSWACGYGASVSCRTSWHHMRSLATLRLPCWATTPPCI